ncbi:hypothetical protein V6N13_036223 [Hibiscus sabdariffa]|uniref:Uncharacterized protein n=1 Tax=Hibiscus sabdariffa TaxID=183260 RepID=A0ABR2S728_9ROSI
MLRFQKQPLSTSDVEHRDTVSLVLRHSDEHSLRRCVRVSELYVFLSLSVYVFLAKEFEKAWEGFSLESFHCLVTNLKLALPSAAMVWVDAPFGAKY